MYRKLIDTLKNDGWIEQRDGEVYINGEFANNFGKDGVCIHISFGDMDEEVWLELFGVV